MIFWLRFSFVDFEQWLLVEQVVTGIVLQSTVILRNHTVFSEVQSQGKHWNSELSTLSVGTLWSRNLSTAGECLTQSHWVPTIWRTSCTTAFEKRGSLKHWRWEPGHKFWRLLSHAIETIWWAVTHPRGFAVAVEKQIDHWIEASGCRPLEGQAKRQTRWIIDAPSSWQSCCWPLESLSLRLFAQRFLARVRTSSRQGGFHKPNGTGFFQYFSTHDPSNSLAVVVRFIFSCLRHETYYSCSTSVLNHLCTKHWPQEVTECITLVRKCGWSSNSQFALDSYSSFHKLFLASGFLWQLLCDIARQHGNSMQESGCQTDGFVPPEDSLGGFACWRLVLNNVRSEARTNYEMTSFVQLNDFEEWMNNMPLLEAIEGKVSKNASWLIKECWMNEQRPNTTWRWASWVTSYSQHQQSFVAEWQRQVVQIVLLTSWLFLFVVVLDCQIQRTGVGQNATGREREMSIGTTKQQTRGKVVFSLLTLHVSCDFLFSLLRSFKVLFVHWGWGLFAAEWNFALFRWKKHIKRNRMLSCKGKDIPQKDCRNKQRWVVFAVCSMTNCFWNIRFAPIASAWCFAKDSPFRSKKENRTLNGSPFWKKFRRCDHEKLISNVRQTCTRGIHSSVVASEPVLFLVPFSPGCGGHSTSTGGHEWAECWKCFV